MRIALIGYGKMGHMIESLALKQGHAVVARIDKDRDEWDRLIQTDVAIEFSTPMTAKDNILRAWKYHVPVVCGTTGWGVEPLKTGIGDYALIWSSNYSIGVNLLFTLNKELARLMARYPQYTPSIVETHHVHKLDKPSGTAKTLSEQILAVSDGQNAEVPIDSIREGEVPGIHTVTWDSEVDTLSLTHTAKSREGFALGALLAAEWIIGKKGYHDFEEVLRN